MKYLDWGTIVGLVAVAGFLWRLSYTLTRDVNKLDTRITDKMGDLGERVARIEGALFLSPVNEKKFKKD